MNDSTAQILADFAAVWNSLSDDNKMWHVIERLARECGGADVWKDTLSSGIVNFFEMFAYTEKYITDVPYPQQKQLAFTILTALNQSGIITFSENKEHFKLNYDPQLLLQPGEQA